MTQQKPTSPYLYHKFAISTNFIRNHKYRDSTDLFKYIEYELNIHNGVTITNTNNKPILISHIEYYMRRAGTGSQDWRLLKRQIINAGCGTYSYTRTARPPGVWDIKVKVYTQHNGECDAMGIVYAYN